MPVTWPNEGRRMQLGGMVDIRVLGPIEVFESGHEMAVGPQLRRLLGLLMAADGRNVRADAIAEDLADGDVDVDGSKIRTAVSRLRKIVGDRIETVPAGYRLRLSAMESDVDRFDALRAEFGTAPPSDRVEIGLRALALWRGPALGDLAEEPWAHAWAARLDESRAALLEDVAEAMLELDRPHTAVELLDQHVVDNPYRERPVELLMRGQAASGQRPAALRSYQRLRIALRDDLGLDPSPELQALEGELLAAGGEGHGSAIASSGPTLTVLFTDIEGSTQMWRRDQHTMSRDLVEHDRTLEDAIGAQGGRVFKHTGDGMGAVFTTADAAVRAARRAQGALRLPTSEDC